VEGCVQDMIFVNFLIFFCHLKFANSAIYSQNKTSEEFLVSTAIVDICEEFFFKRSIKFDLIIYGERTRHLSDISNGVLNRISHNFSSTVQYIEDVSYWDHKIQDSALILFKNANYLAYFNSNIKVTNFFPKIIKLFLT